MGKTWDVTRNLLLNQGCSKHLSDLREEVHGQVGASALSVALCLAVGAQSCPVTSLVLAGSSVKWGCRRLSVCSPQEVVAMTISVK